MPLSMNETMTRLRENFLYRGKNLKVSTSIYGSGRGGCYILLTPKRAAPLARRLWEIALISWLQSFALEATPCEC
ncbi:hypothetical protein K470DRAFT_119149 [Piedraia hortae CBS 480.64]|uniref:Uncharacterized protein n=1 Tax=Piedraia hortae CBS 480.64 TaxID=1314780 RepID=A0A6A7BTM9_9PEZI|nr:hypothetical protein K470DRAFT_119149 [Piedraia hortae CBS 480.64]